MQGSVRPVVGHRSSSESQRTSVSDFAAPFGSKEWLQNYFGVQGTDFNYNADGAPSMTDQGRSELTAVWRYVTSPACALFSPNRSQEFAQVSYAAEQAMIAAMDLDPTLGLYSPTAAMQGPLAQNTLHGRRLGYHSGASADERP